MKYCKGCGVKLQDMDKTKKGYIPKADAELCQRCFRLNHYDDLTQDYQKSFDNYEILETINQTDALIVWIVDIFDFESNLIAGINRHLLGKDIILVGTKRDLIPKSVGNDKLFQFMIQELKDFGIEVNELLLTSAKDRDGLDDLKEVIELYHQGRDVLFMGQANVGKSSLINALLGSDLTVSRYPGTTLGFSKLEASGITYIDTPGLINEHGFQYHVAEEDLKVLVPSLVKPKSYASSKSNSFLIEGLVRIDISAKDSYSTVFYMNKDVAVHRTNLDKAEDLWSKRTEKIHIADDKIKTFQPKVLPKSFDIVLAGLGFVTIKGKIEAVSVMCDQEINVRVREALL